MSYLFYQVLLVKEFMIGTGIAGIMMMIGALLLAVRGKRGFKHYGIQALFFRRNAGEMLFLSCAVLQFVMVISCIVCKVPLERIHLLILAVLCVIRFMTVPEAGVLFGDMLHMGLLVIALFAGNLLDGYIQQSSKDVWFMMMYWLLNIFIAEYAIYYFMRSVQLLAGEKDRIRKAQSRLFAVLDWRSRKKQESEHAESRG